MRSPETAAEDAARALRRASVERRPVVLNIPIDLVELDASDEPTLPPEPPSLEPPRPAERSGVEVADLIAERERPVLLAGRGAALAGGREALENLGERTGALLATSAAGNGLFAGNFYELGIAGGFSSPCAVELMQSADLVLAFGASLNRWTVRHGKLFPPDAKVVQVDLDEEVIGALYGVDVGVVGDASATAREISEELERRDVSRRGFHSEEIAREISGRRWRDEPYEDEGTDAHIDPRTLSIALDDLLPEERTVATDSGHFMGYPAMYLQVPDEQGFVFTQAFQSVGLGLASGIGAAVARPDRLTVIATGDGGALMALGEIETAARYKLPLVIIVYKDAAYGAEVHHFGPMDRPVDLAQFPDTDFAALARAAGAEGATVRKEEDLTPVKNGSAAGTGRL